ncbi:hypothetical protein [Thermococcus sp.]|nr:hypothetical protein [Thermococcus sp.]
MKRGKPFNVLLPLSECFFYERETRRNVLKREKSGGFLIYVWSLPTIR